MKLYEHIVNRIHSSNMHPTRGLKITSIIVLSPILLIILSLICILCYSTCSYLMELYQPTTNLEAKDFIPTSLPIRLSLTAQSTHSPQHSKYCKQIYSIKRLGIFSRIRQSPLAWCIIISLYCLYIFYKKKKIKIRNDLIIYNIEPLQINEHTTKKNKRRRTKKLEKQKQKLRFSPTFSSEHSHTPKITDPSKCDSPTPTVPANPNRMEDSSGHDLAITGDNQQNEVTKNIDHDTFNVHRQEKKASNNNYDLLSPDITPVASEDEEPTIQHVSKKHNWYSPFSTGLDLDILPRTDPLCQYKVDFHVPPSPPSDNATIPSLISLFQRNHLSNIELLQNHPFIPTTNTNTGILNKEEHLPHSLGPIGVRVNHKY
ncbi:hypothetical protein BDB01DRAFT_785753 [Pilobolus umbonatus]|nr:hypothetical protein BDB01DRAFT_785753 [Pilobolus umbonatus]